MTKSHVFLMLQLTYYECHGGYCSEIYNLKCERRCKSKTFRTTGMNSILFVGEKVIMANCDRSVVWSSRLLTCALVQGDRSGCS